MAGAMKQLGKYVAEVNKYSTFSYQYYIIYIDQLLLIDK